MTIEQKTEQLLFAYPGLKLSDDRATKKVVRRIETALDLIRSDYYFGIIEMIYFDRLKREAVAVDYQTSVSTITRNKKRLIRKIKNVLFAEEFIKEIYTNINV